MAAIKAVRQLGIKVILKKIIAKFMAKVSTDLNIKKI